MRFAQITALLATVMTVEASYDHVYRDRTAERREIIEALTHFKLGETHAADIIMSTHTPKVHPKVLSTKFKKDEYGPIPEFSIFGFSDYDAMDYVEGFFSGVFEEDVRDQWTECIVEGPEEIEDLIAVIKNKFGSGFRLSEIFQDFELIQQLFDLGFKIFVEGPKELKACKNVYNEVSESVNWVLHHLSITQALANVFSNLFAHFFDITTDSWSYIQSLMAKDYYEAGKLGGELFIMLFN